MAQGAGNVANGQLVKGLGNGSQQWVSNLELTDSSGVTDLFSVNAATGAVYSAGGYTNTPGNAQLSGILYSNFVPVSTGSGTGAQTLMSYTMPAGTLQAGRALRITVGGTTAGNTNTKTVTIKFGATTIANLTGASNGTNFVDNLMVGYSSASAQASQGLGGAFNGATIATAFYSTPAENALGSIVISVVCTDGTDSAGDITLHSLVVELV